MQSRRVQLGFALFPLLLLIHDAGKQGENILSLGLTPVIFVNLEFNQVSRKWKLKEHRTH